MSLLFAETLLDVPYIWWTGNETEEDDMFYCDKIPSLETLHKKGINCAGFINLVILHSGKTINHNHIVPRGGTGFWFVEFTERKVLQKIDYTKTYPIGTLLFRTYKDVKDQGHFAVIYDNLNNKIIHAYAGHGVGITDMVNEYAPIDYYEYIVEPTDWLF